MNRINLENGATFEVVHLNLFLLGISFEVKEKNILELCSQFYFYCSFDKNRSRKGYIFTTFVAFLT